MEFWQKKPFSIRFVHKFRKFPNFEPTLDYMLRKLAVRPIFPENSAKSCARVKRKRSWKLAALKKNSAKLPRESSRGAVDRGPGRFIHVKSAPTTDPIGWKGTTPTSQKCIPAGSAERLSRPKPPKCGRHNYIIHNIYIALNTMFLSAFRKEE